MPTVHQWLQCVGKLETRMFGALFSSRVTTLITSEGPSIVDAKIDILRSVCRSAQSIMNGYLFITPVRMRLV